MKTLALALALSLLPGLSIAQTPPAPAPAPPPARPSAQRDRPVIQVDGVVARPYFWVQSRAALHYQPAEPRRTFAPTVVRAVRQAPF